jgi:hypothetical protein
MGTITGVFTIPRVTVVVAVAVAAVAVFVVDVVVHTQGHALSGLR